MQYTAKFYDKDHEDFLIDRFFTITKEKFEHFENISETELESLKMIGNNVAQYEGNKYLCFRNNFIKAIYFLQKYDNLKYYRPDEKIVILIMASDPKCKLLALYQFFGNEGKDAILKKLGFFSESLIRYESELLKKFPDLLKEKMENNLMENNNHKVR